ncbi:putative ribonuclease H-like domain-containing protein [Senna tora]|uniref:Putative ribonuclease H-like domain-containing protein n=1 Tax=Senna tora TaxID=362788 RepID=A0A834XFK6_9FABA|nr:putative ribonuclease H-like domain-containing protein [Senna tora]
MSLELRSWKWREISFDYPKDILSKINAIPCCKDINYDDRRIWKLNSRGWCKLNTYGSSFNNSGSNAARGSLRDLLGNWIHGFCKHIGFGSSLKAEVWAIALVLELASKLHYPRIIVESDSAIAFQLLTKNTCDVHYLGALILFCISKLRDFAEV